MAKNKKCRQRKPVTFSNGGKQNKLTFLKDTTDNDLCQYSSFTQQYQAKKKAAKETGWHCGKSLLSLKPEYAMKLLRQNGLHAWLDYDGNLYGPGSETKESTLVLAKAGDSLSIKIACEYFGASEQELGL